MNIASDTLSTDTLVVDSLGVDTLPALQPGEYISELIFDSAIPAPQKAPVSNDGGMSWIFLVVASLFALIGIRFHNSSRYVKALISDLTQTRTRSNAFDETVNETSFLLLLNLMWVVCAGILLWNLIAYNGVSGIENSFSIPNRPAAGIGICIGISLIYLLLMHACYWMVGTVFTDSKRKMIWMKGATASYALCAIFIFAPALLICCYPQWGRELLYIGAAAFIFCKILYICQGFRIFFTQISSWLVFLYYLCSLEIVPLIITYVAALFVCGNLL